MQKTKIEWTDYTWNPIKGLCPVGCWYCYARKMYKRFGWNPEVELDGELFGSCQDAFAPNIKVYEKLGRMKPGNKIFICSTFELFHPCVHKEWRDAIFQAIKEHPHLTFQILTKLPHLVDRPMPDNVWLGTSIGYPLTEHKRAWDLLLNTKAKKKFISFEPLSGTYIQSFIPLHLFDWIIVGRLTGHGKMRDPYKREIELIAKDCRLEFHTPLFMKNNLKEIWGEPLIQEMPNV